MTQASTTDWQAVRFRLEVAADALGIPWHEVEHMVKATDAEMLDMRLCDLDALAERHGVCVAWLLDGDLKPLLIHAALGVKMRRALGR